nr:ABC-three component system middle component 1 [uncultured Clostridium sp.]
MILDEFVSIISSLSNTAVISDLKDSDMEILLDETDLKLYHTNHKYYFLSIYQDDYNIVEKNIKNNLFVKEIENIRPNNSYLILFYKIKFFNDEVSKKIIRLEENEFFYKKYVFYYTEEEYVSFIEWFKNRKEKSLSSILKSEECSPESMDLYMQFLLRLVIKIPFLKLEFKKMELDNFDDLLESHLNGIRKNKAEVHKILNRLTDAFEKYSPEEIAETLFLEIIGGADNENQIS